ncbi:protein TIC 62, chloroplastic-like [Dorcoceras hygrometricum]|uniref:Protein TIC 62, chloroplastic-like n=1 Tax=Dorcoceras hygrometricum TaxID=472368 RepID=A0A2Z7CHE1_9LAMI|nr:protein TIC 62, chloroplastic-like [Dorcoceras hygrometricum]
MAPFQLPSNSLILPCTPLPTFIFKNPRLFAFAKKGDDSPAKDTGNSTPFRFDFGNLPNVQSLVPAVASKPSSSDLSFVRRKDPGTVFVAGATGQAGIRIAQTLLLQGFSVRAGVPDIGAAQELAQLAVKYKIISSDDSRRLNAVNSTFQDAESIAKAIGNASKVVVTVGPAENGPTSEVTISDAIQVIQAAQLANVGHVTIIYDGSPSVASTYNVLDGITSFFSNIFSRTQPLTIVELLQEVVETNFNYTLIKTKLTEDFSPESSYNVVFSTEGRATGPNDYKVAKSQIALLVADIFTNTSVAENKVVVVYTDPSASSNTISELFRAVPEDGRRKAYAEAQAKAKLEEEANKETEEAAVAAKKLKEETSGAATKAQKSEEKDAGLSVESIFDKAKDITGLNWLKFSSQLKLDAQKPEEEDPKVQVAAARGQAKARALPSLKAVMKSPPARQPPKPPKSKVAAKAIPKAPVPPPAKTRKLFGGLFSQETIYVDDA